MVYHVIVCAAASYLQEEAVAHLTPSGMLKRFGKLRCHVWSVMIFHGTVKNPEKSTLPGLFDLGDSAAHLHQGSHFVLLNKGYREQPSVDTSKLLSMSQPTIQFNIQIFPCKSIPSRAHWQQGVGARQRSGVFVDPY